MVRPVATTPNDTCLVAAESGLLHRPREEIPGKLFPAADDGTARGWLKQITLPRRHAGLPETGAGSWELGLKWIPSSQLLTPGPH